jgi:hypothetical protein
MTRRPPGYRIPKPAEGWRPVESFTDAERAKLLPIAETLAMLDDNAFLGTSLGNGRSWADQYLPEAYALYESSGGDSGWAGEASFAKVSIERTGQ